MKFRRFLIRNTDASDLLELFLIASVVSVLGIRAFLAASGYPQIGGDGLHIAHMLWGGLFMVLALILLFSLLGHVVQRFAAILAGVGFGTFIDELGKFITSDNNYFFQPTIGIIYILFISIFLVLRTLRHRDALSPEDSLANVFNHLAGAARGYLDVNAKGRVTELLNRADSGNPLVQSLKEYLADIESHETSDMSFYFRLRDTLIRWYSRVVLHRWFPRILIGFFVLFVVAQLTVIVALITAQIFVEDAETITFVQGAQLTASSMAGALVAIGIWQNRRSRLEAYRWFLRAILVSIFITQVFAFLDTQFGALSGLIVDVLVYIALSFMIERERDTATLDFDNRTSSETNLEISKQPVT